MKDGTVFENDASNHPVNSRGYRMSFDTADLKYNADLALKDSVSDKKDAFSKAFGDAGGSDKGIVAGMAAVLGVGVVSGAGYAVFHGAAPAAAAAEAPEAIELADTIFSSWEDAGAANMGFDEATTEFGATAEEQAANLDTLADTISEDGVQYDSGVGIEDANADGVIDATELQTLDQNVETATQEFQAEMTAQTPTEQSGMPPRINMTNKFYWSQHTREEIQAIQNAFNESLANPGEATAQQLWAQHAQAMTGINALGAAASQSITAKIAVAGTVLGVGGIGVGLGVGLAAKKTSEAEAEKATEQTLDTGGKDYKGTPGNDTWAGTDKNDYAVGLHGNDTLSGLAGNDRLHGNEGNDTLSGGDGADRLFGEQGDDTLTGGAGADRFIFELKNTGVDHVSDFQPGEDKIELSEELAGLTFETLNIVKLTDTSATTEDYSVTNAENGINLTVTTRDIHKGLEASDFIFS